MTAPKKAPSKAATKPTDHKQKVVRRDGTLTASVRGQRWTIEEAALNDWEIIEDLNIIENEGNPAPMPGVLRALLGDDQYLKAKEHLRDKETGRISLEEGAKFLGELFEVFAPNS